MYSYKAYSNLPLNHYQFICRDHGFVHPSRDFVIVTSPSTEEMVQCIKAHIRLLRALSTP